MIADEQKYSRWKRHEAKTATPDTRSPKEIVSDDRKTHFQRAAEQRDVAKIEEDRASASISQRLKQRGQQKTEGSRNKFGDAVITKNDPLPGPKDKMPKPAAWGGSHAERNGTGLPMDSETQRLRDAMRNDPKVSDRSASRAPTDPKPQVAPTAPKDNSFEDLQAMALYVQAAHPEIPLNVREDWPDENLKRIARQNSANLANCWRWLVFKGLVRNDLTGLLAAFDECKAQNAFDDGKPRVRGFRNQELINIIPPPPDAPENTAINEALELVRSGRARLEKMRPATDAEEAEIRNLRAMPFSELRKAAIGK